MYLRAPKAVIGDTAIRIDSATEVLKKKRKKRSKKKKVVVKDKNDDSSDSDSDDDAMEAVMAAAPKKKNAPKTSIGEKILKKTFFLWVTGHAHYDIIFMANFLSLYIFSTRR